MVAPTETQTMDPADAATDKSELKVLHDAFTKEVGIPKDKVVRYMSAVWAEVEAEIRQAVAAQMAAQADTDEEVESAEASARSAEALRTGAGAFRRTLVQAEVTRRLGALGKKVVGRAERKRLLNAKERARRKREGLCLRCPKGNIKPARENSTSCEECGAQDAASAASRRARKKSK